MDWVRHWVSLLNRVSEMLFFCSLIKLFGLNCKKWLDQLKNASKPSERVSPSTIYGWPPNVKSKWKCKEKKGCFTTLLPVICFHACGGHDATKNLKRLLRWSENRDNVGSSLHHGTSPWLYSSSGSGRAWPLLGSGLWDSLCNHSCYSRICKALCCSASPFPSPCS